MPLINTNNTNMNTRLNTLKKTALDAVEADISALRTPKAGEPLSATRVWQWMDKKISTLYESMDERFSQMSSLISDHENKIAELITKSEESLLNEIDKRFSEIKEEMDVKLCQLSERVSKLEYEQQNKINLNSEIHQLKKQLAHQENVNVSTNIRICGVPYLNNENLYEIFEKLCASFNLAVPYIKSIYRVKDRRNTVDGVIMVKLFASQERNTLLRAIAGHIRENKKQLSLHMIGFNVDTPFFVNEDLTNNNYKTLQAAIKLKRRKLLLSAFTLRGIVYIKRRNSDRPLRIDSTDHLNSLFRCDETPMSKDVSKADDARQ